MPDVTSLSAEELFARAGITPTGSVAWGSDVPSGSSGVYVISVRDMAAIKFREPFEAEHRERWKADQDIIYIGKATTLSQRLAQFRRHVYGKRSPHRGGQAILLLDVEKSICFAVTPDIGNAEDALIRAFVAHTGRLPFGNRIQAAKPKKLAEGIVPPLV